MHWGFWLLWRSWIWVDFQIVFKQVEAVQLIADSKAPKIPQSEEGASYEGIQKKSNAKVRHKDNYVNQSQIKFRVLEGKQRRSRKWTSFYLSLPLFLQVNMAQPAEVIHNWIRGHDKVPGAWVVIDGKVHFLST